MVSIIPVCSLVKSRIVNLKKCSLYIASRSVYAIPVENEVDPDIELNRINEEIAQKCNKSKLSPYHYNIIHGKRPCETSGNKYYNSLEYQRKMFALYGFDSGVNPAICFQTKEEIEDAKGYEKVYAPRTIQEMRKIELQKLADERAETLDRERYMKEKLMEQDEMKRILRERIDAKMKEAQEVQAKRDKLIEEVKRHFGYHVDPHEERFKELLEQKEKEQKKIKRQERKKKKEEMFMAKIASLETKGQKKDTETKETVKDDED